MSEGPKGEKRLADVIGNAVKVMRIGTGKEQEDTARAIPAAELGRRGGAARAQSPTRTAAGDRQKMRRLALEQARMSDRQAPWWNAGTGESLTLKVERGGKPPLPWTWEIISESGRAAAPRRSLRGYRSAEEAWAVGQVALADLRHERGPAR